jgi:hypothetical protein
MTPDNSSQAREAGLRRLKHARRWIAAGSVTLAGVLAAVAANAFPGKTVKPSGVTGEGGSRETSTNAGGQPGESSESSGSVTPPEQAPQSGETAESAPVEEPGQAVPEAPVISGGS